MTAAQKPIKVALDAEDLAWLEEQAYPFGLDAAGYLRMYVRQGRLNADAVFRAAQKPPMSMAQFLKPLNPPDARPLDEQYPYSAGLVANHGDGGEISGESVDLDAFVSGQIDEAERQGLTQPEDPGEELGEAGGVIPIGPRLQRTAKEWATR